MASTIAEKAVHQPRSYQLEMLEDSIRRNIIVAMPTGSGKTQIAVLRIAYELERCPPEKLVWFICPNVTLAEQQHQTIQDQLPAVQSRLLLGNDGTEHWTEQSIWNEVLQNIRIVVSTPQILFDVLTHVFVRMQRLALLVFDEAHHCTGNHPAARILQQFYHPERLAGKVVPHILGLTASPISNEKSGGLEKIEQCLHAITRTPARTREELMRYSNRPSTEVHDFAVTASNLPRGHSFQIYQNVYWQLDLQQDPYIIQLNKEGKLAKIAECILKASTYCQKQLRILLNKGASIQEELGTWASQTYIDECIDLFLSTQEQKSLSFTFSEEENQYLRRVLGRVKAERDQFRSNSKGEGKNEALDFSPKVMKLIEILVKQLSGQTRAIVFVKTRASVALVERILAAATETRDLVRSATFVGTSNSSSRKFNIGELVDVKSQVGALDDLRDGKKNLIISTSVCEEGIDISACNLVICFEKPLHLRSFIQRRGRARAESSKYVIMFRDDERNLRSKWEKLEAEMNNKYANEQRELEQLESLENSEDDDREFVVESTGAKIRPQDAVSHLYHFCSSILNTEYVNLHPEFQYETKLAIDNTISVRGKVFLPNAITPELRAFTGSQYWKTKKLARADVAFEAYVKLYEAGLLNANLLYLKPEDDDVFKDYQKIEKRPSLVSIPQQYDPWLEIVERWRNKEPLHETTIHIKISSGELFRMAMVLPQHIPQLPSLDLYPSTTTMATLEFAESSEIRPDDEGRDFRENWTKLLLGSVFATRWPEEEDPVWLTWFSKPVIGTSGMTTAIQEREHALDGYVEMDTTKDYPDLKELNQFSIIRDRTKPTQTYTFHGVERRPVIQDDGSEGPEEPHFKLLKLPKKVDLMRPFPPNQPAESTNYLYVRSAVCDVDGLPWYHCQFARFIPSIMHHVERELVANHLNEQIFASSFKFQSLEHLKTAITTSAAQETENYQRLEFFGDSILKMYTTVHLLAQHMNWHEGYLSHAKDSLVSNRRLAIAAVQSGIAFYIRTQPFPVNKWKPPTIYSVSKSKPPGERDISSKTLADVIEALLGAAFFDGKEESIVHLLNMLLPELRWTPLSQRHQILFDAAHVAAAASGFRLPAYFSILVSTVGYEFRLPYLLLTAVTHPSCLSHDLIPSYQRLEFLGDSMLDFIVTSCIREHASNLTVGGMHLVRTTVVNADFLAFCCMNNTIPVPHVEIVSGMHDLDFASVETNRDMAIWHFMRHNHAYELVKAQKATFARFQRLREDISSALNGGSAHPWTLLAGLDAPKFFSDLIESILGAIYIDSSGSEEKCIQFLEHVGIMPYLKRLLNGGIKVISPKEELNLMTADYRIEYTQDFPKPGKVYCADGAQDGEMEGGRKWTVTVAIYPNSYDQYDCREWTVVGETSKIEAEMRAAEMAIHSLRGLEA